MRQLSALLGSLEVNPAVGSHFLLGLVILDARTGVKRCTFCVKPHLKNAKTVQSSSQAVNSLLSAVSFSIVFKLLLQRSYPLKVITNFFVYRRFLNYVVTIPELLVIGIVLKLQPVVSHLIR